jgi:hypothetical protein
VPENPRVGTTQLPVDPAPNYDYLQMPQSAEY